MSRLNLIDKDALMDKISVFFERNEELIDPSVMDCAEEIIEQAESVDAVEVVHGTWTVDGIDEYELSYGSTGYEPVYRCSRCGHVTESYLRLDRPIMPEDADFPNYCPNCGAKMDGEVNGNEE